MVSKSSFLHARARCSRCGKWQLNSHIASQAFFCVTKKVSAQSIEALKSSKRILTGTPSFSFTSTSTETQEEVSEQAIRRVGLVWLRNCCNRAANRGSAASVNAESHSPTNQEQIRK